MSHYAQQFKEEGFCIIPGAIGQSLVSKANAQIDLFRNKNDLLLGSNGLLVEGMLQRVINLHFSITALQEIFLNAMEAGHKVVDQYGEASLYTSLFFELGSEQALHRDTPYFYSGTAEGYMGVWVALDDVDESNGALLAVNRSHKLSEPDLQKLKMQFHPFEDVPVSSTPLFNAYNEELKLAAKDADLPVTTCIVKKGDMIIWDPSTLHGGLPHRDTTRTRRSFVMHITPKNMPMKHMDFFFHREKEIEKPDKAYLNVGGRLISAGDMVDFRHIKSFTSQELGVFD